MNTVANLVVFLILIVVDTGHMLGLDQEREELGRNHVLYRYGDPSFNYVCLFVCMYYYSIVNR